MTETALPALSAERAVKLVRRDVLLGRVIQAAVVMLLLAAGAAEAVPGWSRGGVLLLVVGAMWVTLALRSMRGVRLLAVVGPLIAAGEHELAEPRVAEAVRSFSVLKGPKMRALEHLALLRHAEKRYRDAALLCRTALALGSTPTGRVGLELMLGEAALETNDLPTVWGVLGRLQGAALGPREGLKLLEVQLDYGSRVGAWVPMLEFVGAKAYRLEHLSAGGAARAQALLALAAHKTGRTELADWLRRRVLLLADADRLIAGRPALAEVLKPKIVAREFVDESLGI